MTSKRLYRCKWGPKNIQQISVVLPFDGLTDLAASWYNTLVTRRRQRTFLTKMQRPEITCARRRQCCIRQAAAERRRRHRRRRCWPSGCAAVGGGSNAEHYKRHRHSDGRRCTRCRARQWRVRPMPRTGAPSDRASRRKRLITWMSASYELCKTWYQTHCVGLGNYAPPSFVCDVCA